MTEPLATQRGFHGPFESEALPGALPARGNTPRHVRYGLYSEQLNGVSFTVPRAQNRRVWLYRIRPSTMQSRWAPFAHATFDTSYLTVPPAIDQVGWKPRPIERGRDFLSGLITMGGAGDPTSRRGYAIHTYACDEPMERRALVDHDGTLMLLPDTGRVRLTTEVGALDAGPGELLIVPRGMVFRVDPLDGPARGFVGEAYARQFELPERGVIGSNGVTEARHFEAPLARFDEDDAPYEIIAKTGGHLYRATRKGTPFDVVAWHGELAPLKYDLANFCPVGPTAFDHLDPSLYTVLSAPLDHPGENALDLVVFPERWDATQDTFRPPFFHRNAATEINGILTGAERDEVFSRGGLFVTPPHTPHGLAESTVVRAWDATDEEANRTHHLGKHSRWMQFESTLPMQISPHAMAAGYLDPTFGDHTRNLPVRFSREG